MSQYIYRGHTVIDDETGTVAYYAARSSEARRMRDGFNKGTIDPEQFADRRYCNVVRGSNERGATKCGEVIYAEDAAGFASGICEKCGQALVGESASMPDGMYAFGRMNLSPNKLVTSDDRGRQYVRFPEIVTCEDAVIAAARADLESELPAEISTVGTWIVAAAEKNRLPKLCDCGCGKTLYLADVYDWRCRERVRRAEVARRMALAEEAIASQPNRYILSVDRRVCAEVSCWSDADESGLCEDHRFAQESREAYVASGGLRVDLRDSGSDPENAGEEHAGHLDGLAALGDCGPVEIEVPRGDDWHAQSERTGAYRDGFEPCIICGRAVNTTRSHWRVRVHHGGSSIVTNEEGDRLNAAGHGSAELGTHPIGPECLKAHPEIKRFAARTPSAAAVYQTV